MGKVIKFYDQVVKHRGQEANNSMMFRKFGQWRARNHQMMQETAERKKREALQERDKEA